MDFAFGPAHLVDSVIDDLDGMELVEGDGCGGQAVGNALDEGRGLMSMHTPQQWHWGRRRASVRYRQRAKNVDSSRQSLPSVAKHDAGLVDIDKTR